MLYLFDLDGTLVSNYMDNPDKDYDVWDILPGRKARLQQLLLRGDTACIITNQGGVAFGHVTEYQADTKLDEAVRRLGLAPTRSDGSLPRRIVYACYHHEQGTVEQWNNILAVRRKPNPDMLHEAILDHPEAARLGVLMVGDRQEDYDAAQAAGVPFQWAHVFFGS